MYGRDQYSSSIEHAEDLSDPALGLNLDCIRPYILLNTDDGTLPMVPVFSNTYGMLINNDIFEREGLTVPTTYSELAEVCSTLREEGYDNPIMGFSNEETTSLFTLSIYPYFCGTVAQDAEAVAALNSLDPSAGEYIRPYGRCRYSVKTGSLRSGNRSDDGRRSNSSLRYLRTVVNKP